MNKFTAIVSLLLLCGNALGQGFPNKPVRVVVPYPPGGGADVVTRVLTPRISELIGQPVVVDNRAGAGGNIGTDAVAKSPADGYTLLVATASSTINTTLTKSLGWDLMKDFAPVVHLVYNQSVLTVHPSVPASNVRELIALAKAKPGQLTYASYGNGSSAHLISELFKMMAGVDLLHVPYKGAAPAVNDLIGGQVNVLFADVAAILSQIKAGKAKALGLGSTVRYAGLPDVPTIAESGVPGFSGGGFLAFVAPAGTPRAAIDVINGATVKVLAMPEVRERLSSGFAAIPVGGTPEQLSEFLRADIDRWARVIRAGNIKAD
jgi:tripartite-type tricarboxylate transporter receptor subunit TctC